MRLYILVGQCCAFLGEWEGVDVAATVDLSFAIVCTASMTNNTWSVDHSCFLSST